MNTSRTSVDKETEYLRQLVKSTYADDCSSDSDSDERRQVKLAQERAKIKIVKDAKQQHHNDDSSASSCPVGAAGARGASCTSTSDTVNMASNSQSDKKSTKNMKDLVDASNGTGLLDGGKMKKDGDESDSESSENDGNCSICSYDLKNVVKLKCGHKFCYSCIKGHIIAKHKECPYCQKIMTADFIKTLLTDPGKICKKIENVDDSVQYFWIYDSRGNNGWWNFDNKANQFLERDYQNWLLDPNRANNMQKYTLMVCGTVMEIDFNDMVQINPINGAYRKIDRVSIDDLKFMEKKGMIKGVAGINRKKDE